MASQQQQAHSPQREPILTRINRLDIIMGYLEELKEVNRSVSGKSSGPTSPSSGTVTSDGGNDFSINSSPKSIDKRCRPIDSVIAETQLKGSLVDRLVQLENRVLKLSLLLEEEIEAERKKEEEEKEGKKSPVKGLKRLVKSCVNGGGSKHKKKSNKNN
ncbi:uncharacterized protein LOC143846153 [Tasmannia lanceolata]|uniref:uncharacterized protein LOC143846153 n=1 Tax=Tasmannia lanceolata TaxID=3420 RepID=UPI004063877E